MAGEAPDNPAGTEIDELAGVELFEIPDDLKDMPDYGAPAPDAGTDPEEGPPAAHPAATQPRDAEGKFAEKPNEDPEGASAAQPGQPPEGSPAENAPDTAATTDPAPGAEEEEPELEFSFRADGQPITIKGSKITKDYVQIPRAHMADVQKLLSHGVTYQGSFRRRLEESARREAEAKAEVQEEVVRARATLEFIAKKFDEGPEAVQDWLDDFARNRSQLEAEATLAVAKAYQERKPIENVTVPGFEDEVEEFAAGVDRETVVNELSADLTNFVPSALRELGIRGLTGPEIQTIISELADPDEIDRYFGIAGEDMPEYGVTKGQLVRKDAVIAKTLKRRAELVLGARRSAAELEAAKQKNNGGRPANPIPPTTTATGGTPGKGKKAPLPRTKEELDKWMDDDEAEP
jgi:transposase-like protein